MAAAGSETKGSRSEQDLFFRKTGTMLFIMENGWTGVPVAGTTYFTPVGGSAETAPTGRICTHVNKDWKSVPGLCFCTAHFLGFPGY